MHTIRLLLLTWSALLVLSQPAPAQNCPPGWSLLKDGNCLVPGYRPCGRGGCAPDARCEKGRCVGGAAGPTCSRGNTCGRGEGCTPAGQCYNLTHHYLCGSEVCMRGYNYPPGDPCLPCVSSAPVVSQDDMAVCKSASTRETADRNIAACTRVINNANTSRSDLPSLYQARCVEWVAKGDLRLAIADCNQAIAFDGDYHAAYNARGSAYEALGDVNQAIADYSRAASLGLEEGRKNLVRLQARK